MNNTIKIEDKLSIKKESHYLIISNKEKCKDLILNSPLDDNNIVDILISLHIVLEVSLNALYRNIASSYLKDTMDELKIMEDIDSVSFIDKTRMFICWSKFNFGNKRKEAREFYKIIHEMKLFSDVRNKLLHGHSISIVLNDGVRKSSETQGKLNPKFLNQQIKRFCFIMKGMRFYLDCLESEFTDDGKKSYKEAFLDDSFLPYLRT